MKKIIILIAVLLILLGCGLNKRVEYYVNCTATPNLVNITIENEDGGTSQFSDESTPWVYTFESESGEFVYVSAQNQQDHGTVTVIIYIDDEQFKKSTSTGAYVIASASGIIP